MKKLILQQAGDWATFRSNNSTFINCLRSAITPHSYRKYDKDSGKWFVWWEKIGELVDLAKRFHESVDRSTLPNSWQHMSAGASVASIPFKRKASPYSKLFLTEEAPMEVVKAVYQALLSMYHPDHNEGGGDATKLNQVIEAYKEIKKKH